MRNYTFKEFLNGEFSILVNENTIKNALELLSKTNLKWHSGVKPNEHNLKYTGYMCLVVENGSLGWGSVLSNWSPLITIDQLTIEDDDLKENYFIGQCVKSVKEQRYKVGNLYYFNNGKALTDENTSGDYDSIEDFNNRNKGYFEMAEIKEVKRMAKVGEFVKIVNARCIPQTNGVNDYKNGDVLKIIDLLFDDACYSKEASSNNVNKVLVEREYVVLEGYKEIENLGVGDMVQVVDPGKCFTTYNRWFEPNGYSQYESHYVFNKLPTTNKRYEIVGKRQHWNTLLYPMSVYAIQDLDTTQVFLINEKGIKKID